MEIRSAALIGAGAVGSFIAYALTGKKDIDFCIVADGARKERLRVFRAIRSHDEDHFIDNGRR